MGTRFSGSTENVDPEKLRFSPIEPGIFRAVPVEKLRFFPVQPENMRAVPGVEPENRVPIPVHNSSPPKNGVFSAFVRIITAAIVGSAIVGME
mgnify:CR=1 FL=1